METICLMILIALSISVMYRIFWQMFSARNRTSQGASCFFNTELQTRKLCLPMWNLWFTRAGIKHESFASSADLVYLFQLLL